VDKAGVLSNPGLGSISNVLVGFLGAYLNPEIQGRLRHLAEKLDQLAASDAAPQPTARTGRIPNGLVAGAIERTLAEAEGPMRVREIHATVEDLLGIAVPIPSVNYWLSKSVKGDRLRLVRLERGRYRLLTEP
jgi:hypothetical protein